MPNWEKFIKEGSRIIKKRVSLNTRGVFSLNRLAYEELGKPEAVILLFDKQEELIGLQVASANSKHSYKIRKQPKNSLYMVSARAFCTYYQIDNSKTLTFDEIKVEDNILILDLNKTIEAFQSSAKHKYKEL